MTNNKDNLTLQDFEIYGFDSESVQKILSQLKIVLEYGAKTYRPKNWQFTTSIPINCKAAQRHINEVLNGIEHDIDTQCYPLYHAICRLLFATILHLPS